MESGWSHSIFCLIFCLLGTLLFGACSYPGNSNSDKSNPTQHITYSDTEGAIDLSEAAAISVYISGKEKKTKDAQMAEELTGILNNAVKASCKSDSVSGGIDIRLYLDENSQPYCLHGFVQDNRNWLTLTYEDRELFTGTIREDAWEALDADYRNLCEE